MKELEELLAIKSNQRSELTLEIMAIQKVLVMLKTEEKEIQELVKEAKEQSSTK